MNGKINTPRTVCKAIVAVAIAAIALAAIIGCSSLEEVRAGRTSPRSSRPPTTSADAKCTCGEAVRFPDERDAPAA